MGRRTDCMVYVVYKSPLPCIVQSLLYSHSSYLFRATSKYLNITSNVYTIYLFSRSIHNGLFTVYTGEALALTLHLELLS